MSCHSQWDNSGVQVWMNTSTASLKRTIHPSKWTLNTSYVLVCPLTDLKTSTSNQIISSASVVCHCSTSPHNNNNSDIPIKVSISLYSIGGSCLLSVPLINTNVTWGASLLQWEYLWSPRMGHARANAMWTLIWCFTPGDTKKKQSTKGASSSLKTGRFTRVVCQ